MSSFLGAAVGDCGQVAALLCVEWAREDPGTVRVQVCSPEAGHAVVGAACCSPDHPGASALAEVGLRSLLSLAGRAGAAVLRGVQVDGPAVARVPGGAFTAAMPGWGLLPLSLQPGPLLGTARLSPGTSLAPGVCLCGLLCSLACRRV